MFSFFKKRRLPVLTTALTASLLLSSCDKGFEELNTNPNAVTDPVMDNLFSYSIVKTAGTGYENHRGNLIYCGAMIQHFASLQTYWSGDKYLYNAPYTDAYFETAYQNHVKEPEQIIALTKNDAAMSNQYNIARIWRVFAYHRITDLYGDIPYSQAAQGYLNNVYTPKYDRQQDIYADMLKELDEAAQGLDASKASYTNSADVVYAGDLSKWKKFAYSMMLRLGMRVTKADATMAETYVKKAIAGGVMQSNDDIAKLAHIEGSDNTRNLDSNTLNTQEYSESQYSGKGNSKLSKTFVDFLKNNNDPRLPFIATLWQGNANPAQEASATDPAKQKGLPNGYDAQTIVAAIPGWTDNSLTEYSEANLNKIASNAAPTVFQSYAEVEYLLAEAALRGWGDGQAAAHYNKGVTAAMSMMSLYGGSVTSAQIETYLTAHPFSTGTMAQQMEQVATQYWAVNFLNSYEAYANWRRTGYPVLTPTNYVGNETGGTIPRRLRYPTSEASKNATQYNAAVAQQGADLMTTRIWWDKQ